MSAEAARCGLGRSRSGSSGPRALSDRPLTQERVVLCVGAYPEPRHVFADFSGERAVVKTYPCRPERADVLEVEGRMLWVSLQQTNAPIGQFPNCGRKCMLATPEARGGQVLHKVVVRPARTSRRAALASLLSRPSLTSRSNCSSHAKSLLPRDQPSNWNSCCRP